MIVHLPFPPPSIFPKSYTQLIILVPHPESDPCLTITNKPKLLSTKEANTKHTPHWQTAYQTQDQWATQKIQMETDIGNQTQTTTEPPIEGTIQLRLKARIYRTWVYKVETHGWRCFRIRILFLLSIRFSLRWNFLSWGRLALLQTFHVLIWIFSIFQARWSTADVEAIMGGWEVHVR